MSLSVDQPNPSSQAEQVSCFHSFTSLFSRIWESVKNFFCTIALALSQPFHLLWNHFFREREVELLGCILPETKADQEGVLHAAVEWLALECVKKATPHLERFLSEGIWPGATSDLCWDDRALFAKVHTFCRALRKLGVRDLDVWEVRKAVLAEVEIRVGKRHGLGEIDLLIPLFEQRVPDSKGTHFKKCLLHLLSRAWVAQFPAPPPKEEVLPLAMKAIGAEQSKEEEVRKILEKTLLDCRVSPRISLFTPLFAKDVRVKDPEKLFDAIGAHLKMTRVEFLADFWKLEQIWERTRGRRQFAKLLANLS